MEGLNTTPDPQAHQVLTLASMAPLRASSTAALLWRRGSSGAAVRAGTVRLGSAVHGWWQNTEAGKAGPCDMLAERCSKWILV
jgi:hypothetical protein